MSANLTILLIESKTSMQTKKETVVN